MIRYEHFDGPLQLEGGGVLPEVTVAYSTYGELSPARDNVIWVCHALTANSEVAEWWEHTVEEGKFLDPAKYFVVCANFLGSHYGTTGPLSINPATGEKWYGDFPQITVRDMVRCHRMLAERLGIEHVELLIGSSIGGFQCLEWAVECPDFARRAAFIATAVRSTPWITAFNESQRWAIEIDPTFGQRSDEAGIDGMAVARSIALMSYRGGGLRPHAAGPRPREALGIPRLLVPAPPGRETTPAVQRLLLLPHLAGGRLARPGPRARRRRREGAGRGQGRLPGRGHNLGHTLPARGSRRHGACAAPRRIPSHRFGFRP